MNRCKTCRFWGVTKFWDYKEQSDDHRQCTKAPHLPYGWVTPADYTERKKYFADVAEANEPNTMGAEDYSGYAARVLTGPEFGCVLWEAR